MHPKIKYELHEFEQLLLTCSKGDDISMLKQSVRFETDRITQSLALDALTLQSEEHVSRYIQYHQHAIGRLMDKITELSSDSSYKDLYQFCHTCLEELLSFVEHYFAKYFDHDAKAPASHLAVARKSAKENQKKFQAALADRNADPRLIDLLLRTLKKISDKGDDHNITYRKVVYVKEVQKELSLLLNNESVKDIDESLREIMYYLNYNSYRVLTYHAHHITSLLDNAETRAEKIEKLSFLLKTVNQAQVKPGIKYHPHGLSLKDQLNNYLVEELQYHERLLVAKNSPEVQEPTLQGFKLKFTASVSQMAYLLKILIETKIILNNNLSQILHFLVKYVVTKKSEAISHGSFRSKYYVVESGTKESVRNMLMTLVHYIDKN